MHEVHPGTGAHMPGSRCDEPIVIRTFQLLCNSSVFRRWCINLWLEAQAMTKPDPSATAEPAQHLRRNGSYGLDAPYLLPVPLIIIIANVANGIISRSPWPFVGVGLVAVCSALGLYASLRGKFAVWADLLNQVNLRGDERILDLGCGRGAVLLLAAQHLTSGKAVGVDLWKKGDQSGNSMEATLRNAAAEGVAARVELHTASMTALPFPDNSFDLVLSNVAVHNVKGAPGRS